MSYESFKKILGFIVPHITPNYSAVIGCAPIRLIRPAERLVLAIRFLATGEKYRSLSYNYEYLKEQYYTLLMKLQRR